MPIRMVVGLGNPGARYRATRHNVGFCVTEQLAREEWRECFLGLQSAARMAEVCLLLFCPMTYMNRSGTAVRRCMQYHELSPAQLLVAYDDMDLPLGRIRVRPGGGTGGHRGVESLTHELGTGDFARLRIGIGRPPTGVSPRDHVLSPFRREEEDLARRVLRLAARAVEMAVRCSVQEAMNHYNGRDLRPEDEPQDE